jgi:hypothetical protein
MKLAIQKAPDFIDDFDRQFRWYAFEAERSVHGARDLPRRLLQPPGVDDE